MTEEERLEFAQMMRHDIVRMFMFDADGNPTRLVDSESGTLVKGVLKDMDASIYTNRRLSADEASAESDKVIAESIERILAGLPKIGRVDSDPSTVTYRPSLANDVIDKIKLKDTESSAVGDNVDIDEVMAAGRAKYKDNSTKE